MEEVKQVFNNLFSGVAEMQRESINSPNRQPRLELVNDILEKEEDEYMGCDARKVLEVAIKGVCEHLGLNNNAPAHTLTILDELFCQHIKDQLENGDY